MDLGGGMVWALDLDDFRNRCGGGRHPLLSTIRNILGPAPDNNEISGSPYPPTFSPGNIWPVALTPSKKYFTN